MILTKFWTQNYKLEIDWMAKKKCHIYIFYTEYSGINTQKIFLVCLINIEYFSKVNNVGAYVFGWYFQYVYLIWRCYIPRSIILNVTQHFCYFKTLLKNVFITDGRLLYKACVGGFFYMYCTCIHFLNKIYCYNKMMALCMILIVSHLEECWGLQEHKVT